MDDSRGRRRELLRKLCEMDGFMAAAACLEQPGDGVILLPEGMMETRDGREEAISALQEAFETDYRCAAIVIRRGE